MELEAIFQSLPSVSGARTQITIEEWLSGNTASSLWDGRYDKFADFVSTVLETYLPWVLRAFAVLAHFTGPQTSHRDFRLWAEMVEYGVDTRWAVAARSEGAPATRLVIAATGRQWPEETSSSTDPLGLAQIATDRGQKAVDSVFARLEHEFMSTSHLEALARLKAWVYLKARRTAINPD
jgi:hypothetical protein